MPKFLKKYLLSLLAGALVIFSAHHFLNLHWTKDASLDIIVGAVFEVFILQILWEALSSKHQKQFEQKLNQQLAEIQKIVKDDKHES